MENLNKVYDPKEFEDKWYKKWEDEGCFKPDLESDKKSFTVMIPPPNVTSVLHMGHGLNNTIQDVIVRYKRMDGFNTLWVPGTDHAGIATQNVVEKMLAKEGKTRSDLGREKFLEHVWKWREEYGGRIINQLKKLGSSCDWSRTRFTKDEGLSEAVKEAFVTLYNDGLIYKGEYIINWCPRCGTALSDEEVEHEPDQGFLYHIRYYLKESDQYLIVATTRPETLLGDTAVAVHPEDERYKDFIGKSVILPIVGRELPVIADTYVDREFGTGALKITPAHDHNDFEIGLKYKLPIINVMNPDGTMNSDAGKYKNMDRFDCRNEILKDLKEQGFLDKEENYDKNVGICYRCSSVVEPYVSSQWFVKMEKLAAPALKVVEKDEVDLAPKQWKKVYLNWMNNIRDWCISRQIWWGHRIPAWYCDDCSHITVSKTDVAQCEKCNSTKVKQDEDVLDTWFSSWLWPISTLGWPEKTIDLETFYPTQFLSTAPEILFFWVARMIMAGLYFEGKIPFDKVYLHSTVCDSQGRKMSKSLGNGIDPLEIIDEYGTDSLRFTILYLAPIGQRIRLAKESFDVGSRFANKLWNASRFILMNIDENFKQKTMGEIKLNSWDNWILSSLEETIKKSRENLESYRFNELTNEIYHFIWSKFCDWYLESSKVRMYSKDINEKNEILSILLYVLEKALRLLHPVMPYITEEIWQKLPNKKGQFIMNALYPSKIDVTLNKDGAIEHIQDLIYHIRNIRGDVGITPEKKVNVIVSSKKNQEEIFSQYSNYIKLLAKVKDIDFRNVKNKPEKTISAVGNGFEVFVQLDGLVDLDKEKQRINKELEKLKKDLNNVDKKLNNESFLGKAPADIIEKEKNKKAEFSDKIDKLYNLLSNLK